MTLTQRRLYYGLITIIFLVLVPLVIYLTSGYQLDVAAGRFVKTGVILVDSKPADAAVRLNGRATGTTTPERLAGLKPGTYQIALEKEGRRSWQSVITVRPNQSTIVGKPLLFLQTPSARVLIPGSFRAGWTSNNRHYVAVLGAEAGNRLSIFNMATGSRQIITLPVAVATVTWSPGAQQLLVKATAGSFHLLDRATEQTSAVPTIEGVRYDQIHWQSKASLVAHAGHQLFRLDLADRSIELMRSAGVTAAAPAGADLTWVVTDTPTLELIDQSGAVRTSYQLPSQGWQFAEGSAPRQLALFKETERAVLILDANRFVRVPLTFAPERARWNAELNALTLSSTTELWAVHRVNGFSPTLLERVSGGLGTAHWFTGTHLVYEQDNDWSVIDTSPVRDHVKEEFWQGTTPPLLLGINKNAVIFLTDEPVAPGLYQMLLL